MSRTLRRSRPDGSPRAAPYDGGMTPPTPVAVRRPAAGLLRRTGEARRRGAVPRERHPRPRHPARAAGRGRRALLRLRRPPPINDQNRDLLAALRADLAAHGIDLPVYWGNRNWDPTSPTRSRRCAPTACSRAAVLRDQRLLVVLRRAGSTARTSPTPSSAVAGCAAARPAAALLQPPRLRRARRRRRRSPRWPTCPTRSATARTWSSSPTRSRRR